MSATKQLQTAVVRSHDTGADTKPQTLEEIIEVAKRDDLSISKVKSLLYHAGLPKNGKALDQVREALGREKGPAGPTEEELAAQKAAEEQAAQARREEEQRRQREQEAEEQRRREEREAAHEQARNAITDGAVVWCDAAENTVERAVNRFGRKQKFANGGYRIGLLVETEAGDFSTRHYNTKCPDQFAGECYSVLKAIELAKDLGLTSCMVRNDRIGGFGAVSSKKIKRGYAGAKYLYVAKKIAEENGIEVIFDRCTGNENKADRISRTEGET